MDNPLTKSPVKSPITRALGWDCLRGEDGTESEGKTAPSAPLPNRAQGLKPREGVLFAGSPSRA